MSLMSGLSSIVEMWGIGRAGIVCITACSRVRAEGALTFVNIVNTLTRKSVALD